MFRKLGRKIANFYISVFIAPAVHYTVMEMVKDEENAPLCHEQPMEYMGKSIGFQDTKFYQCEKCKRIELV